MTIGASNAQPTVLVQRLDAELPLPAYALPGDAGADIATAVDVVLAPGERAVLPTGLAVALPDGFAAFVHPRSGLAARAGMSVLNAPGTIDAGYRGEIKVIVINHDPRRPLQLRRGDRIAQLVIQRVEQARFVAVPRLPRSERGTGGHGSTGGVAADRMGDERIGDEPSGAGRFSADRIGDERIGDERIGDERESASRSGGDCIGDDRLRADSVGDDRLCAGGVGALGEGEQP